MRFRWFIIAVALGISAFMLLRPEEGGSWGKPKENIKSNIKLGLDLQGGIFMQLEVDEEDALRQFLEEQAGTIKASLEGDEIGVTSATPEFESYTILLNNVSSDKYPDLVRELKDRYDNFWNVTRTGSDIRFKLREVAKATIRDDAVKQTVYKIQNRISELGVTEPVINRTMGSSRIVLELAGASEVDRVQNIVREPGKLEWRLVLKGSNTNATSEAELLAQYGGTPPPGSKVFPYPDPRRGATTYLLLKEVMLTASNVSQVFETRDDRGLPAVGVTLDRAGGQIFNRETGQNIGNLLAIVLDGKILSAPVIRSQLSERFIIEGQFRQSEVQDMVVKIKSGSLPAKVEILEIRQIGPTLGRDAIRSGVWSAIIGLVITIIFILLYYRVAGIFAVFALVCNMLIIMGMLSGIGAVLTLPGIAGFILTIGMAVDANVLIFERIREELKGGTAPKNAMEIGYKAAFVTILDANITTFIAAFCLLLLGEGPVKGFAVMLMMGIVSSIFTAVFCSHTFFQSHVRAKKTVHDLSIWPVWQNNRQPSPSH